MAINKTSQLKFALYSDIPFKSLRILKHSRRLQDKTIVRSKSYNSMFLYFSFSHGPPVRGAGGIRHFPQPLPQESVQVIIP